MERTICYSNINAHEIHSVYKYNNIELLKINIKYPIISSNYKVSEDNINNQILSQVNEYFKYAINTLYQQAMDTYNESIKNDFPFHSFEAYMEYIITYNDNCYLSLYTDKYQFTGGAHGSTIRTSNTWELCSGKEIFLCHFFKPYTDYIYLLKQEMILQANKNLKSDPLIYFENYKELIVKNFNPQSFYMSPEGLVIYYQQYDIAPYSTGIVEFTIPYSKIRWIPSC